MTVAPLPLIKTPFVKQSKILSLRQRFPHLPKPNHMTTWYPTHPAYSMEMWASHRPVAHGCPLEFVTRTGGGWSVPSVACLFPRARTSGPSWLVVTGGRAHTESGWLEKWADVGCMTEGRAIMDHWVTVTVEYYCIGIGRQAFCVFLRVR